MCVLGNSRKRYRARGQRWEDPDDTKSQPYCRISCRTLCEKNKWKPYMWTGDKDVNMKAIFAVISTTWAVVEIRPDKNSFNVDIVIYFDTMKSKLFVNFSRALQKYLSDKKHNSLHLAQKYARKCVSSFGSIQKERN